MNKGSRRCWKTNIIKLLKMLNHIRIRLQKLELALQQALCLCEGKGMLVLCVSETPLELPVQASSAVLPKGVRSVCDSLPWRYSNAFGSIPEGSAGWK